MKKLLTACILLTLAVACEDRLKLDQEFTLQYQESKEFKSHSIKFSDVISDSRCPEGALCTWEGQAEIEMLYDEEKHVLILREGNPDMAKDTFGSYIIELLEVKPYPERRVYHEKDTYSVTLKVSK